MEMSLPVTYQPHPLSAQGRAVLASRWEAGRTIRAHLLAAGVDPHREIVVRHNGRLLPVGEWDRVCPVPGELIQVEATVSGGDDGSNPIVAILSIVVMVFATWAAPSLLGAIGVEATTTTLAMAKAAIFVAGNLVIGALFRPSQASSASESAESASPTYSLAGGSNRLRPYEPLPVVMGNHRIFPDYGAKPYTEFEGDEQYLYQVFNFGLGDLSISDLRIGNTLLSTYAGVEITRAENGVLPGFWGNVDSSEGAALSAAAGWIVRTTGLETTRIAVDLVGTFFFANKKGGLSEHSATFALEYSVAGANAWQPFIPDDYVEVTHYWAYGFYSSSPVDPYYDDAGNYVDNGWVSVWIQESYDSNTDPGAHVDGEGDGHGRLWRWLPLGADPHPVSAYNGSTNTLTLAGASSKPQRRTVVRTVPSGQYDVRARRTSPDDTDSKFQSATDWTVMRSYQEGAADYTDQTVIGIRIKASGQLNGALEQLSAHAVVSTWVWTGSAWARQPTTNPAWWYLALARGYKNPYGRLCWGGGLTDAQIDIEGLKAWAAFCEAESLSFSAVFDQSQTLADALQTIARCGMASPSWASGKLGVVWDAPNQAPVMAFGMANICKGGFEVAYVTDNLADEIVVNYTDRHKNWESNQVRVTVPGTVGTPVKSSSVDLMGCTTNAHAAKFANALAAQQYYRRRNITWETDMEGFVCQRGDVVILSHDLTQWGYSGRLVAVEGVNITLSKPVPRSGTTDYLMIQSPDGETEMIILDPASGDTDTLTLPSPLTLQPGYGAVDHKWYFSPLPTPGKKVKITSVQPLSETRIRLTATDEDPAYYAAWNGTFTEPPRQSLLSEPVRVDNLLLVTLPLVVEMRPVHRVTVAWTPHGAIESHTVRAWLDDVLYQTWTGIKEAVLDLDIGQAAGVLRVEVTPIGLRGPGAPVSGTLALGALPVPPAPLSVQLYATPDELGQVSRARVKVTFDSAGTVPVAGLLLFFAAFPYENRAAVASGGTGPTLTLASTDILHTGTVTVLAGSTPGRIVTRTAGDPYDTTINHGGRWWARLPGGEWKKCTGLDALALLFDPPHEIAPSAGMLMEYAEIAWADNRQGDAKVAILHSGSGAYEIIRWDQLDQDGPTGAFRLLGCERGAEGTTPINADGNVLHYYPAPGAGTAVARFPAEVFAESSALQFVGETDVDLSVPAGYYAAGSAAVYATTADGNYLRSAIVPVTYGGPL